MRTMLKAGSSSAAARICSPGLRCRFPSDTQVAARTQASLQGLQQHLRLRQALHPGHHSLSSCLAHCPTCASVCSWALLSAASSAPSSDQSFAMQSSLPFSPGWTGHSGSGGLAPSQAGTARPSSPGPKCDAMPCHCFNIAARWALAHLRWFTTDLLLLPVPHRALVCSLRIRAGCHALPEAAAG